MIKNKKAQLGHGLTWFWKFLLLILVIGGTVAVVVSHYSKQYDVRTIENAIISRKLIECIAPKGIYEDLITEKVRSCLSLNEDEIYLNISIASENKNVELGKSFLATLCEAKEKKVAVKYYPSCLNSNYLVLKQAQTTEQTTEPSKLLMVSIFLAIKKVEKNL
ncbi:MAG: hypothetical protein QW625_02825 [Candidatus Nanoarchaeia archaeon]